MTRIQRKTDPNIHKHREAYEKVLIRLRALQEECERPENRYICPCISVKSSANMMDDLRETFQRMAMHVYPHGPGSEPVPINADTVAPNEIFYRMLASTGDIFGESIFSPSDTEALDRYKRWEPGRPPQRSRDYVRLTRRAGKEIKKLQARQDRGYGYDAPACRQCFAKTPERDIQMSGALGLSSLLTELIRDGDTGMQPGEAHYDPLFAVKR